MQKHRKHGYQVWSQKIKADESCHTIWNAGFNYRDIPVEEYSTVKVRVINPEKVRRSGSFWENSTQKDFHVGDEGYIAVRDTNVQDLVQKGFAILEVLKTS